MVGTATRPQRAAGAPPPGLSSFGFVAVRCGCCGANICGTKFSCGMCHRVVDEVCMQLVKGLCNASHGIVVLVEMRWHPTLLNVMAVASACMPLAPLMGLICGVPRGSLHVRPGLYQRHVRSSMHDRLLGHG